MDYGLLSSLAFVKQFLTWLGKSSSALAFICQFPIHVGLNDRCKLKLSSINF